MVREKFIEGGPEIGSQKGRPDICRAATGLGVDGPDDIGVGMPQKGRPRSHAQVEKPVAVRVGHVGAAGLGNVERIGFAGGVPFVQQSVEWTAGYFPGRAPVSLF